MREPAAPPLSGAIEPLLRLDGLESGYGDVRVLRGPSLWVGDGEVVALLGPNAAGKTTLLQTISGLVPATGGAIWFAGQRIDRLPPHEIVRLGLAQVPSERRLFHSMTVEDNLHMGAYLPRPKAARENTLGRVFELFPILAERRHQIAGSLSGGEQQMLAIARALMSLPRLLLIDEPSTGLAPIMVRRVFELIDRVARTEQVAILLVEQNVPRTLALADRGYVLDNGAIVAEGTSSDLLQDARLSHAYLGLLAETITSVRDAREPYQ